MKRTAEVVLGVIGALGYGFMMLIGIFLVSIGGNQEAIEDLLHQLEQEDPEVYGDIFVNVGEMAEGMADLGWTLVVASVLAVLLGVIAMLMLKGNKKPKPAGIIFIIVAVLGTFFTYGFGLISGIFYLIAGIMSLVRKPKQLVG